MRYLFASSGRTELKNSFRVRPTIKLTVEQEEDGKHPFLDMLVRRRESGSLDTSVCRKPMHMNQYLHFESHHPTHVKKVW